MRPPPPERRPPGQLEQAVYEAVAAGDGGVTAAEVIARVDPSLAYTTVVTTLGRLTARGVLSHRRAGRTVRYAVVGDSGAVVATSTARRMHRLLESAPDRDGALAQFVAGLSSDDEARLIQLISADGLLPADGSTSADGLNSANGGRRGDE